MQPQLQETALEIVAELPAPPGNIAVSSSGRKFFTFHPEYSPKAVKLAELTSRTDYVAFPSATFQDELISPLALRVDLQERLWVLDYADHGVRSPPTLFAFDLRRGRGNQLIKSYAFPNSIAGFGSMLSDFQVDPEGEYIYIADSSSVSGTPALLVYCVADDETFRVLSGHASMHGQSTFLQVAGNTLSFGPLGLKIHVQSLALDRRGGRLYYGAQTGDRLYSISTAHLRGHVASLRASRGATYAQNIRDRLERELADQVSVVTSEKPVTDGIATDAAGNVWMAATEHSAIALAEPIKLPKIKELPRSKGLWSKASWAVGLMGKVTRRAAEDASAGADEAAAAISIPRLPAEAAAASHALRMVKIVQSESLLRWPDGLGFGPDGLYITSSALNLRFQGASTRVPASVAAPVAAPAAPAVPTTPGSTSEAGKAEAGTGVAMGGRGHHSGLARFAPFHILCIPSKVLRSQVKLKEGSIVMPPAGH